MHCTQLDAVRGLGWCLQASTGLQGYFHLAGSVLWAWGATSAAFKALWINLCFIHWKCLTKREYRNYQFRFPALVNLSHTSGCLESTPVLPQGLVYLLTGPELPSFYYRYQIALQSPSSLLAVSTDMWLTPNGYTSPKLESESRRRSHQDAGAQECWDLGILELGKTGVQWDLYRGIVGLRDAGDWLPLTVFKIMGANHSPIPHSSVMRASRLTPNSSLSNKH